MNAPVKALSAYGALEKDWVSLTEKGEPRQLRYADLLRGPRPLVDGVVEQQSQPLLYVIDHARLAGQSDRANISRLRRSLAMRGDPAWLGVLFPGRLDIYATDLQPAANADVASFTANSTSAQAVLPRLVNGENLTTPARLHLRQTLFDLMADAGEALHTLGLSTDETIALIGRALFFQYLIGRGIVESRHRSTITAHADSLEHCFSNPHALADTNHWLDDTFNGDLLTLPDKDYNAYFAQLAKCHGEAVHQPLAAILGLDDSQGPGVSQGQLNWGDLEFNHLPIGLLSEAYEELILRLEGDARRDTSVYYTPARIAEYMVDEALHEHPAKSQARVLDPACGAGVFLTVALRKLAELRYAETGEQPDRLVLRDILDKQLTGFDTNAHARTLAALALYLTALELDPDPTPVEDLAFNKLEGKVLVDVADPDSEPGVIQPMMGSLGEHLGQKYHNAFDLVIGNPPWTSPPKGYEHIATQYTMRSRQAAENRNLPDIAKTYQNPDKVPDLPFVWAAMDWTRHGGRIALALHARWLFKMSARGFIARSSLFQAIAVTGILNGASIRQTSVWPNTDQPFCLMFADNRLPEPGDQFVLVSPEEELELNDQGRMRIDASDAQPIDNRLVVEQPWAINAMYRGGGLDAALLGRLLDENRLTIEGYWKEKELVFGQGYQVANRSGDDSFLNGLPKLDFSYTKHPFSVDPGSLRKCESQGLERPRHREIYQAPIVLVREGSPTERTKGRALISFSDVAFIRSYYGLSAFGHPQAERLAGYLLVLLHSRLFEYVTLTTSGRFGREREVVQFLDIKRFPFMPLESLSDQLADEVDQCARKLIESRPDWTHLDDVVARIYDLTVQDQQLIQDTLSTRAPFTEAKQRAASPVRPDEAEVFRQQLKGSLAAVFANGGYVPQVKLVGAASETPWRFVSVSLSRQASHSNKSLPALPEQWLRQADDLATSRITVIDPEQPLLTIGLLNRYRYWTPTQARLLASGILWEHGAMLEKRAN